jgi:hypothetical protein
LASGLDVNNNSIHDLFTPCYTYTEMQIWDEVIENVSSQKPLSQNSSYLHKGFLT